MRSAIASLSALSNAEEGNIPLTKRLAEELGVNAVVPEDLPQGLIKKARVCRSVLTPNPKS